MGECSIGSTFEKVSDAMVCRDQLEGQLSKPLHIELGVSAISTVPTKYEISEFTSCDVKTSFGADEYAARECADALTRMSKGAFHGVEYACGMFLCSYRVTTDPDKIDRTYFAKYPTR